MLKLWEREQKRDLEYRAWLYLWVHVTPAGRESDVSKLIRHYYYHSRFMWQMHTAFQFLADTELHSGSSISIFFGLDVNFLSSISI